MNNNTLWNKRRAILGFLEIARDALSSARAITDINEDNFLEIEKALCDVIFTSQSSVNVSIQIADQLPILSVIQIACDKCTVGVMDQSNPHLHGKCNCECHSNYSSKD